MEIGDFVDKRYYILAKLGEGGMGVVYQAFDSKVKRAVALKTIRFDPSWSESEIQETRESLLREAITAGRLNHPGIVTIYDTIEMVGTVGVSMEYIEGMSFRQALDARMLSAAQRLDVLKQVAGALDEAHRQGVFHRDIKPSNIMIGPRERAKIADFGIARESARATLRALTTGQNTIVGTPAYMSPEQINGLSVDGRSDQFSLAIMAYEAIAANLPFRARTPTAIAIQIATREPDLDARLGPSALQVFRRALSRNPSGRYTTCEEFVAELEGALSHGDPPPPHHDVEPDPAPGRRSSRRYLIGGFALAFLVAIVVAGSSWPSLVSHYRRLSSPRTNPKDGLQYMWIRAGSFEMGCVPEDPECESDEKPRHKITLTKEFWIGRTEVTVEAYQRFSLQRVLMMPEAPEFNSEWHHKSHPIVNIQWNGASAYCEWAGGRLPSEAEWEYAARAGKSGLIYPWGNPINHENANYGTQKDHGVVLGRDQWEFTAPVGSFEPNEWGLFDMAGNVVEWTSDWYATKSYSDTNSVDPRGPISGQGRVFRGGSWSLPGWALRASWRYGGAPNAEAEFIGFRCLLPESSSFR